MSSFQGSATADSATLHGFHRQRWCKYPIDFSVSHVPRQCRPALCSPVRSFTMRSRMDFGCKTQSAKMEKAPTSCGLGFIWWGLVRLSPLYRNKRYSISLPNPLVSAKVVRVFQSSKYCKNTLRHFIPLFSTLFRLVEKTLYFLNEKIGAPCCDMRKKSGLRRPFQKSSW